MSVTFEVRSVPVDWDDPSTFLNLTNTNGYGLLVWLGLPACGSLSGEAPCREVAAYARRRLWDEARNHDPAVPGYVDSGGRGARIIDFGRDPGYLREKTKKILDLVERDLDSTLVWY